MKDREFQLTDVARETAFAVHRYLGPGHLPAVYENALVHRLRREGFSVEQQKALTVHDEDGTVIGEYFADIVMEGILLLEIMVSPALSEEHYTPILGYLRAARLEHGALLNFGAAKFQIRKLAVSESRHRSEGESGRLGRDLV